MCISIALGYLSLNLLLKIDLLERPLGVDKEDVDDDADDGVEDFPDLKGVILPDLLALKKLCD